MQQETKRPYLYLAALACAVLLFIALATQASHAPVSSSSISVSLGNSLVNVGGIETQTAAQPAPFPLSGENAPASLAPSGVEVSPFSLSPTAGAQASPEQSQPSAAQTPMPAATTTSGESDAQMQALLDQVYALMQNPAATTSTATQRTPAQQALYEYGNAAGLVVLSFDAAEQNASTVLQNWLSARTGQAQIAQVNALAGELTQAGASLSALASVPQSAQADNAALAQAYEAAGAQLKAAAATGDDDTATAAAIKSYDSTADSFTAAYLALSNLFSISGVQFSSSDPGSVFQFSGSSGM